MIATTAIDTALPAVEGSCTSAGKSGEAFANALAEALPAKSTLTTAESSNQKGKATVAADDEACKLESAATTGGVIPPNSIVVPNAPVPLPAPVPDLQTSVEAKQVPAFPNYKLEVSAHSVPNSAAAETLIPKAKLPASSPLAGIVTQQPAAALSELIAARADSKSSRPVAADQEPVSANPEPCGPDSSAVRDRQNKAQFSPETQPDQPQTPVPAEQAATTGALPESLVLSEIAIAEPNTTSNPNATPADASVPNDPESSLPAHGPKDKPLTPARPTSNLSSVDRSGNESTAQSLPDQPLQAVVALTMESQPIKQEVRNGTEHVTDGKVTSAKKESGESTRGTEAATPVIAGPKSASVTAATSAAENSLTPAPADSAVPANSMHTAHDADSRQTFPTSLKPTSDPSLPDPIALGPVHTAKLIERLGQSEMHLGLRTLTFGSVEVHTILRGAQVGLSIGAEKGDLHSLLAPDVGVLSANSRQHELKLEALHFFDTSSSLNAYDFSGMRQDPRSFQNPRSPVPAPDVEPSAPEITEMIAPAPPRAGLSVHA